MIGDDRQGMAGRAIRQRHLALEFHLPQQVRRRFLKRLPAPRPAVQGLNPGVATQDRAHRRHGRSLMTVTFKTAHDLACSPYRVLVANRKHRALVSVALCKLL
jgi:hypothetical protein